MSPVTPLNKESYTDVDLALGRIGSAQQRGRQFHNEERHCVDTSDSKLVRKRQTNCDNGLVAYFWVLVATILVTAVFAAFVLAVILDVTDRQQYSPFLKRFLPWSVLPLQTATPVAHLLGSSSQFYHPIKVFWGRDQACQQHQTLLIYQVVSWILYLISLAMYIVQYRCLGDSDCCGFVTAAATTSMLSLAFNTSSFLGMKSSNQSGGKSRSRLFVHNYMNMLLAVGAIILAITSKMARSRYQRQLSLITSCCALGITISSVFNTYVFGGLFCGKKNWRFFQPFAGGTKFIIFQVASWILFSVSVLLQLLFITSTFVSEVKVFGGINVVAATMGLLAQFLVAVSAYVFRSTPDTCSNVVREFYVDKEGLLIATICANLPNFAFSSMYVPFALLGIPTYDIVFCGTYWGMSFMVFAFCWWSSFLMQDRDKQQHPGVQINPMRVRYVLPKVLGASMPLGLAIKYRNTAIFYPQIIFVAAWFLYLLITLRGKPQLTGHRKAPNLETHGSKMFETMRWYFSGRVLRKAELDPKETYVFGFHPHGVVPLSAVWLQYSKDWRELFPGIYAVPLTATAAHFIPLVRDILQYYGCREVSREAFTRCLQENESVFVVPGGQAEMMESRSGVEQVRVYKKHKGFIRIAIEQGKRLVPILSFGEGELMDAVSFPALQRWFMKTFALFYPFLPYGQGFTPLPRKRPILVCVGEPIDVKRIEVPTNEDVETIHKMYFDQLVRLFEDNKERAGYANHKLVLV